jgi:hypothetical protein
LSVLRERVADGRAGRSRDYYITALREYHARYGEVTAACFSPGSAKRNGRPDLVERYYAGRANGEPWPSLNALKKNFGGSFNAALEAAGLPRNSTGPAGGRRAPGEAEPILTVRERVRWVPNAKAVEATRRAHRADERAARALARVAALEAELGRVERKFREVSLSNLRLRAEGAVEAPLAKPKPEVRERVRNRTRTITKTKTVKVRDERVENRLREKLADSEAARRAVADQLKAAERARLAAERKVAEASARASLAAEESRAALTAGERASDRLAAAEARVAVLSSELAEAREAALGVSEAAAASELVRRAEERADEAELRAARAERQMAEQGAAVTGEARKLTPAEMAELRAAGPAGRPLWLKAVEAVMRAERAGGRERLAAALGENARAAVNWKDRL